MKERGNKKFGFHDSSDVSGDGGGLVTTSHNCIVSQSGSGLGELPCVIRFISNLSVITNSNLILCIYTLLTIS